MNKPDFYQDFARCLKTEDSEVSAITVNSPQYKSWSGRQWLAWTIIPILTMLLVFLSLMWLTRGQFGRISIWTIQQEWFFALNQGLSAWPNQLWSNLTRLGDATVLLLLLSPLIIWNQRAWLALIGAVPAGAIFSLLGKYFAAIPRPAAVLDHSEFTIIGDVLTRHNSLPSGHAITVFAGTIAVLAIVLPYPQNWRHWTVVFTSLIIASILCLSRVAVGAHWPVDLLVGAALGWLAGLSGAAIIRRGSGWQLSTKSVGFRISGLIMLAWGLLLIRQSTATPIDDFALWLAALCGMVTGFWLLAQSFADLPSGTQLSEV